MPFTRILNPKRAPMKLKDKPQGTHQKDLGFAAMTSILTMDLV